VTEEVEDGGGAPIEEAAERSERVLPTDAIAAKSGPQDESHRTREVGDGASLAPGQAGPLAATQGAPLSNRQRKRRRLEALKKLKELAAGSA
jgi:hypothetical protein